MPDLSRRSEEIEIMDDLTSSGEIINITLRELETINYLLGGNYVTIDGISKLIKGKSREQSIHIADLGCGSGDILKLIRLWSHKKNYNIALTGIDANPNIVAFAEQHTLPECRIRYESIDIFSQEFESKKFDVIIGTLFFHHFTNNQLINFFRQVKQQVTTGIVINDIHRHWFAYYSIKSLTRLFSKSEMVKNDAPLSVMRAFKKKELIEIIEKAGFKNYTLRWMWAFRWQVVISF
jgi:2-polyprenyl-3-methyl-5-hydroxy-6-metoxy-1,4-benzoquinol methylase